MSRIKIKIYSSASDEYLNNFRDDDSRSSKEKSASRKLVTRGNASPPNGIIIQHDPEIVIERANVLPRERRASGLTFARLVASMATEVEEAAASFCGIVRRITSAKYSSKLEAEATTIK